MNTDPTLEPSAPPMRRGLGTNLDEIPNIADVPRLDVASILRRSTFNPLLAHLRVQGGFLDLASLPPHLQPPGQSMPKPADVAPRSAAVDWRSRPGGPWLARVKNQEMADNCWCFAAVGLVETMTRIEHNVWAVRSEGDVRDGMRKRCSDGGFAGPALDWMKTEGVADYGCWPVQRRAQWNYWSLQKINLGGVSSGPAAAGSATVAVFDRQQHVVYRDATGVIWDAYFAGGWHLQKINAGGLTNGPPAAGDIRVSAYNDQRHYFYTGQAGDIWDAYAAPDGWHLQKINDGGVTNGPPAAGDLCVSLYSVQQHVTYRANDGALWDAYFGNGGWALQKLNMGGTTNGPAASGDLCVSAYGDAQQHFFYRSADGGVWDAYFGPDAWHLQKINVGGVTNGPPAAGGMSVATYLDQQHVAYRAGDGTIWDAFYDNSAWVLQQINDKPLSDVSDNGAMVTAPAAVGDLCLSVFTDQLHYGYRDAAGTVQDVVYDNGWYVQQLNGTSAIGQLEPVPAPFVWDGLPLAPDTYQAPLASGGLAISWFGNQQHFVYRTADGTLWDAYYDSIGTVPYLPSADRSGRTIRLGGYVVLNDVEDQKRWIEMVGPITASFRCYSDFQSGAFDPSKTYTQQSSVDVGGHELLLVGYDDAKGAWLVRNSWSTEWGDNGYAWFGYGQCKIDEKVKYGIASDSLDVDPWCRRRLQSGGLLQSGVGSDHRGLEAIASGPNSTVRHYVRDPAWSTAATPVVDCRAPPILVTSSFGRNLEMVYWTTGNRLHHWYFDRGDGKWHDGGVFGPTDVAGIPGCIQSDYGTPGNFDLVVRLADGTLQHCYRSGRPPFAWSFGPKFGANVANSGATLVQRWDRGLDLVCVDVDGHMQRFWRDDAHGMVWKPGESFGDNVHTSPVMIRSESGASDETVPGNYELCVAVDGVIQHWWRGQTTGWTRSATFGSAVAQVLGLTQSSFGFDLEVVALLTSGGLQHFWRGSDGWHTGPVFGSAT